MVNLTSCPNSIFQCVRILQIVFHAVPGNTGSHAPVTHKSYQANEVPQTSIKEKAIELGVAVVDQLTEKAIGKLTSILGKIRDRRR